jgi:hypothetical protein
VLSEVSKDLVDGDGVRDGDDDAHAVVAARALEHVDEKNAARQFDPTWAEGGAEQAV